MSTIIEKHGIGNEILELKREGYSLREISLRVKTMHEISVSHHAISRYLKGNFRELTIAGARDDETVNRARQLVEEAEKEFRAVRHELWSYIDALKQNDDLSMKRVTALAQLVKTFQAILETVSPIARQKEMTTTKKTTILEIAQAAGKWKENLEKQGYKIVKINDNDN